MKTFAGLPVKTVEVALGFYELPLTIAYVEHGHDRVEYVDALLPNGTAVGKLLDTLMNHSGIAVNQLIRQRLTEKLEGVRYVE